MEGRKKNHSTFRGPRLYPALQTPLSHHAHPSLLSPAGGGGHAPRNTVMGLSLKSTYWNDFSSLAQCQNLLEVWWVYFIKSRNAAEREEERRRRRDREGEREMDRARGESLFLHTKACVHHPQRVCVCLCALVLGLHTCLYGGKFDVDPLCPLSSTVTAVHLLRGSQVCVISPRAPGNFQQICQSAWAELLL